MQQVWWCIIFCESLKDAFQNTQSIKAKQTQPVWLNIQFEETFGKTKKQQQTNDTGVTCLQCSDILAHQRPSF